MQMDVSGGNRRKRHSIVVIRSLAVLAAIGALTALTWRIGEGLPRGLRASGLFRAGSDGPVTVDVLVLDAAGAALMVTVAVLAALLSLNVVAVLLDGRSRVLSALCARLTPALCRRLVAACCGAGLAAPGLLGPVALADDGSQRHACQAPCETAGIRLGGLQLPDLPTRPVHLHRSDGRPDREHTGLSPVVVRSGDSLWGIADRRLSGSASLADIAALSERLYALNRTAIGDDPDLIFPGMTLVAPEGTS